jgi:cation diffusion facilitator CzcD-associated flavoprotein CzcO
MLFYEMVCLTMASACHSRPQNRLTETFDSVVVCSGHYSDPHIPDLEGADVFEGEVDHSHNYRWHGRLLILGSWQGVT